MKQLYPHFDCTFYENRRNNYMHLGLSKSLFSLIDYKDYLNAIDKFLSEHLIKDFKVVNPPKLVISTKWKHDYIIRSRS